MTNQKKSTFFTDEEREVLTCLKKFRKERSWAIGRVVEELEKPAKKVINIIEELTQKKLEFLHLIGEAIDLVLIERSELEQYLKYKRLE